MESTKFDRRSNEGKTAALANSRDNDSGSLSKLT
jgi:hypothetical protein